MLVGVGATEEDWLREDQDGIWDGLRVDAWAKSGEPSGFVPIGDAPDEKAATLSDLFAIARSRAGAHEEVQQLLAEGGTLSIGVHEGPRQTAIRAALT